MISRYTLPELQDIWSVEKRYATWLDVEILVCEARAALGLIPREAARRIRASATLDIEDIARRERVSRHDVAAFVSSVGASLGEDACYFHEGLTSSDILDTSLAVLMRAAGAEIQKQLSRLLKHLKHLALTHENTLMAGRTHGVHAEPMTFGHKVAVWFADIQRSAARLKSAIEEISVGKISGAVGNFAHLPMEVETFVCKRLELKPEGAATQVVQRDRHAFFLAVLAVIAAGIERIALEIRHLQRTEVMEAMEPFAAGQKGSSAMPHKTNPILCENICGLSRIVRSNLLAALENIPLWHERDISHSSVERVIIPDSTTLVHFMLFRMNRILENLRVFPRTMLENLEISQGAIFSQRILLAITAKGIPREKAYAIVQANALKSFENRVPFLHVLRDDPEIQALFSEKELTALFDPSTFAKSTRSIFRRVGICDDD